MKDKYGRTIDYLRISVTDRCDLRCVYCMPEEGIEAVTHDEILTFDEIAYIVGVMASMGLKKIKLTGGEPLCRKNLPALVRQLKSIEGIESVTITTNGVLLEGLIDELVDSGIDSINISLDTLKKETFELITRRDRFKDAYAGLKSALRYSNDIKIKINCVPISTEDDILSIVELANNNNLYVRFIEVMPIGLGRFYKGKTRDELFEMIENKYGKLNNDIGIYGNGPAEYYSINGFKGRIGFISAVSHKFCNQCNRIRLTSQGFLKTCLQYEMGIDLRSLIRNGFNEDELRAAILKALDMKPLEHHFGDDKDDGATGDKERKLMSQIGG